LVCRNYTSKRQYNGFDWSEILLVT
jgi:hypothetical protein